MIKVPWLHSTLRNRSTRALVELVDVMPTLIDLVNGSIPAGEELDGTSLRPLLEGAAAHANDDNPFRASPSSGQPKTWPKDVAASEFPRCCGVYNRSGGYNRSRALWNTNDCNDIPRTNFTHMGLSIRTDRWRFTRWLPWDGQHLRPIWSKHIGMAELYDHEGDNGSSFDGDFEVTNLVHSAEHQATVRDLDKRLRHAFPDPPYPAPVITDDDDDDW